MRRTIGGVLVALVISGCIFGQHDYVEPQDFDLVVPEELTVAYPVRFGVFRNLSGASRRFLCRVNSADAAETAAAPLKTDEYNRWLLSPDMLLKRALTLAFKTPENSALEAVNITGTIYRFEFNLPAKQAEFFVEYAWRTPAGRGYRFRHQFREKFDRYPGAGAPGAMSLCVANSAKLLLEQINSTLRKDK